ncbi:MAG: PEP-CTERM sorting domain-containing protein [Bryobacterales bacterium]|nr:PEP-CTERM sorting domain-containing protein [Bryobacterales bacterium]
MVSGSLDKKLASYALAGGAALLAGGQAAEAAVVVTTPQSPLVASIGTGEGSSALDIDIDGDSLVDFRFGVVSYISEGESYYQFDSAFVTGAGEGSYITGTDGLAALFGDSASALASNPTLNKAKLLSRYNDFTVNDAAFDTMYAGNFANGVPGTLGVRFMLGGVTPVKGFINARVDLGSVTVTVDQFGYDTGDVPEPGTVSLLALGAAGIAALRRRRQSAQ